MTTDALLWQPPPGPHRAGDITAFAARVAAGNRPAFPRLRGALALVERGARGVLARALGLRRHHRRRAARAHARRCDRMPARSWFPDARLNFAENLLARPRNRATDRDALVFRGEDKLSRRVTHGELLALVSRARAGAERAGRGSGRPGRRVPAERARGGHRDARPPSPRRDLVVVLAGLRRPGRARPLRPDRAEGALRRRRLPLRRQGAADPDRWRRSPRGCRRVERVVVVPYLQQTPRHPTSAAIRGGVALDAFMAPHAAGRSTTVRLPFDHPLYILYSSGTTGLPKCIVHGAGGTLLQHLKEHLLHGDVKRGDRVFYFTTCGWMMWNWLVSALAAGATLLLYDGSPFVDRGRPVGLRRARADDALRDVGQVPRRGEEVGVVPARTTSSRHCGPCSPPAARWRRRASTTCTSA